MTSATSRLVLRDYQQRAIREVAQAYREGSRAILLVIPTGGGKTLTALRLAYGAVEKSRRVLWCAHRRELIHQPAQRVLADAMDCGVIMEGEPSTKPEALLQIASVQTAVRMDLPRADMIILDEARHATGAMSRAITERHPNALIIGLDATPCRADGVALGNVFDRLVAPVTMTELIDAGHLVPCDVIGPSRRQDNLSMDPVDAVAKYSKGKRTVVFASTVAECVEYARRLNERGITAACVDGTMPSAKRDEALAKFACGEIQTLTNVYVLTEGWDCPSAEVCVLARACGSMSMFVQIVGRVLRPADGKTRALLVDLCGASHEHGLPDEDRVYSLDGKAITTKDKRIPLRTCPQCGGVAKPKPVCGRCAWVFPPPKRREVRNERVGTVVARSRSELIAEWEALVRKARTLKKADGSPYNPTWAAVKFKEKFGFWPGKSFPRLEQVAA